MMEKLFKNSRYLVFLTIIVSLLSSVTLYVASLNIIFHVLSDLRVGWDSCKIPQNKK